MRYLSSLCILIGVGFAASVSAADGFFNYGRGENKYFEATMVTLDKFLVSLGYLDGKATVGQPQR